MLKEENNQFRASGYKAQGQILRKLYLIKGEVEKFFRIFIFLLIIAMIIINWGFIKDMFNLKAIHSDLLNSLKEKFSKEKIIALEFPHMGFGQLAFEISDKENSLEIQKIGVSAPLIVSDSSKNDDLQKLLKNGVVLYPGSVLPGEEGQTIILGHSAPSNWPRENYDWVFSRLNELEKGDEIFVYFNHRRYPYKVAKKFFLNKGEEIPNQNLETKKSILILLSCWPPGINQKRIAVQAEILL